MSHLLNELLGFIGVFVLLILMTVGVIVITPIVILYFTIRFVRERFFYGFKKPRS